jgi:hypothetical protein
VCVLANAINGADAGFCTGQRRGCVRAERERQRRLQKYAGQWIVAVLCEENEGQGKGLVLAPSRKGVVQAAHAREDAWRSNISLSMLYASSTRCTKKYKETHHSGAITNGSSFHSVSPFKILSLATRPLPFSLSKYRTSTFLVHFPISSASITLDDGYTFEFPR